MWAVPKLTTVLMSLSLICSVVFIEIEDLLQHFSEPNLMDIKMGTR